MTLHVECVEVYFNDCYDLLNNKAKVIIAGFGKNVKAEGGAFYAIVKDGQAARDENGKWIPPWKDGKQNTHVKQDYEMAGTQDREITCPEDIIDIM